MPEAVPIQKSREWPEWLVSLLLILIEWLKSVLEGRKKDE